MEFIIISGLSGAGKSKAASFLEDMGFFCVDNLPAPLIPKFAELGMGGNGEYDRVVLVTDVRSGTNFSALFQSLEALKGMKCPYRILFMEATDEVIIQRYKETRRSHPLAEECDSLEASHRPGAADAGPPAGAGGVRGGHLRPVHRQAAGRAAPTLRTGGSQEGAMTVSVTSFGFKYGLPLEADLVFDVRFLPNPYYVQELRPRTGLDDGVGTTCFPAERPGSPWKSFRTWWAFSSPNMWRRGRRHWWWRWAAPAGSTARWPLPMRWRPISGAGGYPVTESHRDLGRT